MIGCWRLWCRVTNFEKKCAWLICLFDFRHRNQTEDWSLVCFSSSLSLSHCWLVWRHSNQTAKEREKEENKQTSTSKQITSIRQFKLGCYLLYWIGERQHAALSAFRLRTAAVLQFKKEDLHAQLNASRQKNSSHFGGQTNATPINWIGVWACLYFPGLMPL